MTEQRPPLTALRAFEAAARRKSFAAAAEELNVTPAALSFQIKNLEERLGAPLFRRLNRAVELTEIGRALAPETTSAFEQLNAAWNRARRSLETRRLTVSTGPAFAGKWLAPRLGDFAHAHPEIELRIAATLNFCDFARDDVDLAIRFGRPRDDGLFSEPLTMEWAAPLARPDIAARLKRPSDLLRETLIRDESLSAVDPAINWSAWLEKAGLPGREADGPRFNQADHAIDFALRGGGVLLGRYSIAIDSIRSGALVAPFRIALSTPALYRVVCPKGAENRPTVKIFRAWLSSQVERDRPLLREHGVPDDGQTPSAGM